MNRYYYELYHYGVKGMKWGVRRTKDELRYNPSSIEASLRQNMSNVAAKNGVIISGPSTHAISQAVDRKVSAKSIINALKNPLEISDIKIDKFGRKSQRFIGYKATVNVNPDDGTITTVWPTGTAKRNKYFKRGRRNVQQKRN